MEVASRKQAVLLQENGLGEMYKVQLQECLNVNTHTLIENTLLFPGLLFLAFREFHGAHSALNEADLTGRGAGVCFEADFNR